MTAQEITIQTEGPLAEIGVGDIMLNAPLLKQIDHMAKRMASAKNTVPAHFKGNEGDCWAVIMQSIQWGMNPFVVAQKTHIVNGNLGYEAQLVNAVIQSSGLCGRFHYEYQDNPLSCRVGAVIKGEDDVTWGQWLAQSDVKVQNSPLWKTNPKQQLGYLQVKNWARAYCPQAILGVYTPDEIEPRAGMAAPPGEREINPAAQPGSTRMDDLAADLVDEEVTDAEVIEDRDETLDIPGQELEEPEEATTYAMVAEALNKADSPDTLQAAVTMMAEFIGTEGNEQYKDELSGLYRERLAALKAIDDELNQ